MTETSNPFNLSEVLHQDQFSLPDKLWASIHLDPNIGRKAQIRESSTSQGICEAESPFAEFVVFAVEKNIVVDKTIVLSYKL